MNLCVKAPLVLILLWICKLASAAETNQLDFALFWPPKTPFETPSLDGKPLLKGCVILRLEHLPDRSLVSRLRIMLSRPSDEAGRQFWNSRLAFPEYDWMRYVRVWDKDNRWLWPNLPYLLRLHGIERIERYGGVDPAKGVDNDFAAVLIRKYDKNSRDEDALLIAGQNEGGWRSGLMANAFPLRLAQPDFRDGASHHQEKLQG
jgi:hypothetical protein